MAISPEHHSKAFSEFLVSRSAHLCETAMSEFEPVRWLVYAIGFPDIPLGSFATPRGAMKWAVMKLGTSSAPMCIVVLNLAGRVIDEYNA